MSHGIVPTGKGWETIDVPEFNDCQRFIVNVGGPRLYTTGYFAIFAFRHVTPLEKEAMTVAGSDVSTGVLVAYIYAESNDYGGLQLKIGANCLYLHRDHTDWHLGTIRHPVPPRDGAFNCPMTDTLQAGEVPLTVRPQTTGLEVKDYPSVARWDWDAKNGQQIAGVACDGKWCDVGGASSSGGHPEYARSTSPRERRTVEIKGWYDEQYLAKCASPTSCRPTALVGTIMPDSALDTATVYPPGQFVPVARIAIRVDSSAPEAASALNDADAYVKKGLSLTPDPLKLNQLSLCNGDGKDCFKGGTVPSCPALAYDEVDHEKWWYRITPATGSPKVGCYTRRTSMAAGGVHIVGAARWRWLLEDETNWIRCVEGCCEVRP